MARQKEAKPDAKVLLLRTCTAKMRGITEHSQHFIWPRSGPVEALDWKPTNECGFGLHGQLFGGGDLRNLSDAADAVFVVFEALASEVVAIGDNDKWKAKRGNVIYAGDKAVAMALAMCGPLAFEATQNAAEGKGISSGNSSRAASSGNSSRAASSGNSSSAASSGNSSRAASSGNSSRAASSGDWSSAASSGDWSSAASSGNSSRAASSGNSSRAASSGDWSRAASSGNSSSAASSGNSSRAASSGNSSRAASSGNSSRAASSGNSSSAASSGNSSSAASSGNSSSAASSGDWSSAIQEKGKSGIAAAIGNNVTARADELGCIILTYWVEAEKRYRAVVGYVGEDGIEANVLYKVESGKLVRA